MTSKIEIYRDISDDINPDGDYFAVVDGYFAFITFGGKKNTVTMPENSWASGVNLTGCTRVWSSDE